MCRLIPWAIVMSFCFQGFAVDPGAVEKAKENGELNRKAMLACWRFNAAWLQHADPTTGLIPRNLTKDALWNARDAAADNYPFMVLSAWFTDHALFEGRMHDMLNVEQHVTKRLDNLPDDFLFATQALRPESAKLDDLIFGASEYAKDGLLPLTEWLGPSPWSDRMLGMLESIWAHAEAETEAGKLPTTSHEVAGDLMQVLSRMYWMNKDETHKQHAYTLAAYFLEHHLPTEAERLGLDDHGCEVIGGLSEVYYIADKEDPEKAAQWRPRMHAMLDRILEVGRDADGLLYNAINPVSGAIISEDRTDNWGYNYNAFSVVATLDGVERYTEAIHHVLGNMLKHKDYAWEKDIADGIADSLEGGLNLMNRYPSPEMAEWADYMGQRLLNKQMDTGVFAGWHGDGNAARTLIMYALWKSLGAHVEPWRADVRVGAVQDPSGVVTFSVSSDWPYTGKLRFDIPRHNEYLGIPEDYPRLNQFPEWFTADTEGHLYLTDAVEYPKVDEARALVIPEYHTGGVTGFEQEICTDSLRNGLDVVVTPEQPFSISVWKLRIPNQVERLNDINYVSGAVPSK